MHGDERPRFHLTPPADWMNDPNGLVFRDGLLHVFYQHNPEAPRWDRMHWGHAISSDFVTWRHLPIAISPDRPGVDGFGCWSGCIVDEGDVASMFYTGVALDGGERRASICRATSVDALMVTWAKDAGEPCIPKPPDGIARDAFRDPFVYRDEDGWTMLVGAGTNEGRGTVLRYRSGDLRSWTYVGPFLSGEAVVPSEVVDGPCWECPQLVRTGDIDVLIVSVVDRAPGVRPSHVAALIGRIEQGRLVVDRAEQLGMGPDFYAPATTVTPDGRQLVIGWIPEDPPHEGSSRTWAGSMTLPRIVSIGGDGQVSLALAAEVASLRSTAQSYGPQRLAADTPAWRYAIESQRFEMDATIDPADSSEVVIELVDGDDDDPEARLAYRAAGRLLSVARRGIVSVAGRTSQSTRVLPVARDDHLDLRLIVDGSVMEVEADGRTMATVRLPTTRRDRQAVTFAAIGGSARIVRLETWTLAPPLSDAESPRDDALPHCASPASGSSA